MHFGDINNQINFLKSFNIYHKPECYNNIHIHECFTIFYLKKSCFQIFFGKLHFKKELFNFLYILSISIK